MSWVVFLNVAVMAHTALASIVKPAARENPTFMIAVVLMVEGSVTLVHLSEAVVADIRR